MQNTRYNAHQILEDLHSSDNERIRSAAFAAGDMTIEEAIPVLSQQLSNENLGVQEGAEYALRRIRGPKSVDAVLPLLRSDDASIRNVAMDILREIGNDNMEAMRTSLHDPDPDIRIFISDILGHSSSREAGQLLCEALLKDPEVNVRYQAAVSLGNLGYPETVDSLRKAMNDEEWVQFAVVEALTKINDDRTVTALVQALPTASPLVCSAIIMINTLGTKAWSVRPSSTLWAAWGTSKPSPCSSSPWKMSAWPCGTKRSRPLSRFSGGSPCRCWPPRCRSACASICLMR